MAANCARANVAAQTRVQCACSALTLRTTLFEARSKGVATAICTPRTHIPSSPTTATMGGVGALMTAAMGQRLATFALNAVLLRYVSAEVVGFAAADMELLMSTIMFLAREAVRIVVVRGDAGALLARGPAAAPARRRLVNLAWLPVPVGVVLAAVAAVGFSPTGAGREERASFALYVAAAVAEVAAEPAYNMINSMLLYDVRMRAELAATLLRVAATFALAVWGGWRWGAFAGGQALDATVLVVVYWTAISRRAAAAGVPLRELLPSWSAPTEAGGAFGAGTLPLVGSFAGQSVVKHLLTEADRILLAAFTSREARGTYAVVANYGSLPARFIFQPLEESVRATTSKDAAAGATAAAARTLEAGGRLVVFVGAVMATLGANFAQLAARVVFGGTWATTDLGTGLAAYCVYALLLACNGVTEAFAFAVADVRAVATNSAFMLLAFGITAALAAVLLPRLGMVGIIAANAVSMGLRTAYNLVAAAAYVASKGERLSLAAVLPSGPTAAVLAATVAAAAMTRAPAADAAAGAPSLAALAASRAVQAHAAVAVGSLLALAASTALFDLRALAAAWRQVQHRDAPAADVAPPRRELRQRPQAGT